MSILRSRDRCLSLDNICHSFLTLRHRGMPWKCKYFQGKMAQCLLLVLKYLIDSFPLQTRAVLEKPIKILPPNNSISLVIITGCPKSKVHVTIWIFNNFLMKEVVGMKFSLYLVMFVKLCLKLINLCKKIKKNKSLQFHILS